MFSFTNIKDYQENLHQGKVLCETAVRYYLDRITENNQLNAFVEVFGSECIERAKQLDNKRANGVQLGKLYGVVVAIKDVICFEGHKITAASAILGDFQSLFNATAVQSLLDEDAIIIGNCNCDEFAMGSTNENTIYGRVKNALDESKVPGGSSGGSAVAVQAGMCMVSLGSDTGGSVRQPADFCGIVGLKPSYGTVSRHGLIAYASSFDQIGIFSKNVEDAALVLEIISGKDKADSTVRQVDSKRFQIDGNGKPYRIAYLQNALEHPSLDMEIRDSINSLTEKLNADGHWVGPVAFDLIDYIVPAYYILTTAEASSNLSRYDGIRYGKRHTGDGAGLREFYKKTRSKGFGKEVKRRIMLGTFVLSEGYYDAYFTKAQQVRQLLAERSREIFKDFDAIILPTVPSTAMDAGDMKDPIAIYLADIYTVFANLTGLPAISLPLFKHPNGMPFGVQVVTKKYDEATLLNISAMLMDLYKK
ncbi:MAG: Asp-tRNA(Asn)/Glu-tRNA(Gln) amidotransferase subunit GatA [Ginsengibacter sp.]